MFKEEKNNDIAVTGINITSSISFTDISDKILGDAISVIPRKKWLDNVIELQTEELNKDNDGLLDKEITIKMTEEQHMGKFFDSWKQSIDDPQNRVTFILTEEVIQDFISKGLIVDDTTLTHLRSFIGCSFYPSGLIV